MASPRCHALELMWSWWTDDDPCVSSMCRVVGSGDVVGTVNLEAVVAGHKRRRAENALNIMTVVLAKVRDTDTDTDRGEGRLNDTDRDETRREWDGHGDTRCTDTVEQHGGPACRT